MKTGDKRVIVKRLDSGYDKGCKIEKMGKMNLAIRTGGEYDTDFVDCILWENTAKTTTEYCKKGDIIGVKGRIQSRIVEKDDEKKYLIEIIAEKVTFLSSTNKTDE